MRVTHSLNRRHNKQLGTTANYIRCISGTRQNVHLVWLHQVINSDPVVRTAGRMDERVNVTFAEACS